MTAYKGNIQQKDIHPAFMKKKIKHFCQTILNDIYYFELVEIYF